MKKIMRNYGVVILFYAVLIIGVFALNSRFRYLNEQNVEKHQVVAVGEYYGK